MRISDWSSDVCSSVFQNLACHLGQASVPRNQMGSAIRIHGRAGRRASKWTLATSARVTGSEVAPTVHLRDWVPATRARKSVVLGKSLHVRVDPGCCRVFTNTIFNIIFFYFFFF